MPARTRRCTTEDGGKGKARANTPYPPARQPSNTSVVFVPHVEQEQGSTLLRPPLAHKSSSSSSTGSSRSQRSMRLDLGVPTREEFAALEEQYLESLDKRKKKKALISQEMFDDVWLTLHCPDDISIETPQFRWWVRKMFALVHPSQLADDVLPALEARPSWRKTQDLADNCVAGSARDELVVIHDGKRVAVREQIYDILCACHQRVKHSGRDKTSAEIRKTFTWVPKDLVSLFVKNCPTCMHKKTGAFEELQYPVEEEAALPEAFPVADTPASPVLCDSGIANVMARYLSMPANNVIMASRSGLAYSSSACSLAPSDCAPFPPVPMLAYPEYPPGPGPVSHAAGDHYTSQGNLSSHPSSWHVYPSNSNCHITPSNSAWQPGPQDVAYMPPAPQNPYLQLPNAHDGGPLHPGAFHAHPAKVTLPSFSKMFAGGLTVDDLPPHGYSRQPFQMLAHNTGAGYQGSASLQVPGPDARLAPISSSSSMHYGHVGPAHAGMVPIDPRLLYHDGVRMLALAAEAQEFQRFADENARM